MELQTEKPFCVDLGILFEVIICQCPVILMGSRYRFFKSQVAVLRRFKICNWSQMLFSKAFGCKKNFYAVLVASATQSFINLQINKYFVNYNTYKKKHINHGWISYTGPLHVKCLIGIWKFSWGWKARVLRKKTLRARWELQKIRTLWSRKADALSILALFRAKQVVWCYMQAIWKANMHDCIN